MKVFSAYVPADRRAAIARGTTLPERTRGAVLLADVSGFTPITRGMIEEHGRKRGPEEMAALLNRVFESLVVCVREQRGSVIAISGDALTCWFDEDGGDGLLDVAVARALGCAKAMQAVVVALSAAESGTGARTLSIKVAVAAGPARRFLAGDPKIQTIEVLAGAPLDTVAAVEQMARSGEILVSTDALAPVAARVQTGERRGDGAGSSAVVTGFEAPPPTPWPVLDGEALEALEARAAPWVLPAVRERLVSGQPAFLAELRAVSALFLRFDGIDYDRDPGAERKLDAWVRWAQGIFAHHDGSLLHVTIGDKGSYLNGTFGAPVAHEDDASRAVAAAVELLSDRPAELGFVTRLGVGLARGAMFTGAIGSPERRVYGTSGEHANLAARLMQAVPDGEAWCDATTAQEAAARWEFAPLPSIRVKGVDADVAVARPLGLRVRDVGSAGAAPKPLRGRDVETAWLERSLTALRAGEGGVVVLEGEPGVGKTALLEAFAAQAVRTGYRVFQERGSVVEPDTPHHAWRGVFESLVAEGVGLSSELEPFVSLLDVVLPGSRPQSELVRQMTPEVRGENTLRVLVDVLASAAREAPLVVVFDDAHWIDATSWALAARAVREIDGLLLVVSSRPLRHDAISAELAALLRIEGARRLHLDLLEDEAMDAIVADSIGADTLPDVVARRIRELAEGNAFYGEETARSLRDSERIRVVERRCEHVAPASELAALTLPDTVQGMVASRIDRLPAALQLTLKVASVIGRSFDLALLADVHPGDVEPDLLRERLAALEELELLRSEKREPGTAYRFRHSITQEATYGSLTFAQRRELHTAIGEWYERRDPEIAAPLPLLAHHWERAEHATKALAYLEQAGDHALQSSSHPEACAFFERLVDVGAEDDPRQGRWCLKLGRVNRGWGRFHQAREWLERALDRYDEPLPVSRRALVWHTLRQLGVQGAHRLLPLRTAGPDVARHVEIGQVHALLAELAFFADQKPFSLYAAVRSLNAHEVAGDSKELASAYAVMSLLSGLVGFHRLSALYRTRALALGERLRDPPTLAEVLRITSAYQMGVANLDKAQVDLRAALEIHVALGDSRNQGDCLNMLAHAALYRGDSAEAGQRSAELVRVAQRSENLLQETWGLTWEGISLLRRGRHEDALPLLADALEKLESAPNVDTGLVARSAFALGCLESGDPVRAKAEADATLASLLALEEEPNTYPVLDAYHALADVFLRLLGDATGSEELRASARQTCAVLGRYARVFPLGTAAAWLHRGRLERLQGRHRRARRAFRRSVEAARRFSMPWEEARAYDSLER